MFLMKYIKNEESLACHCESANVSMADEAISKQARDKLRDEGSVKRLHYLMDTFLSIEVFYADEDKAPPFPEKERDKAKEVVEKAFREAARIEGVLTRFREDSQIYRINNYSFGKPCVITKELANLISTCIEFSKKAGGAFDITVAPLMELWANAAKQNIIPLPNELSSLLQNTGYENIILDSESSTIVFTKSLLKIDFGAVGKGYALDRIAEILKENRIEKARLDFGGHLYYFDNSELDTEYIGIRNPMSCEEIIFSIPLENRSISTSANYERHFNIQGKRYGHIINPLSGFPVDNRIASVSVISPSALEADILSTAFFALGLDKGMQLIKNTNEAEAIIVTDNNGKPQLYFSQNYEGGGDAA